MKRLVIVFAVLFPLLASGQFIRYEPTDFSVTPTNLFASNIVVAGGITLTKTNGSRIFLYVPGGSNTVNAVNGSATNLTGYGIKSAYSTPLYVAGFDAAGNLTNGTVLLSAVGTAANAIQDQGGAGTNTTLRNLTLTGTTTNSGSQYFPTLNPNLVAILNGSTNFAVSSVTTTQLTWLGVFAGPATVISSTNVDWASGLNRFKVLTANTPFSFSNTNLYPQANILLLTDGGGPYTVSWPENTAPDGAIPTSINGPTVFSFRQVNGTLYAWASGLPAHSIQTNGVAVGTNAIVNYVGTGILATNAGGVTTVAFTSAGEANTGSNLGAGTVGVFAGKSVVDLQFQGLTNSIFGSNGIAITVKTLGLFPGLAVNAPTDIGSSYLQYWLSGGGVGVGTAVATLATNGDLVVRTATATAATNGTERANYGLFGTNAPTDATVTVRQYGPDQVGLAVTGFGAGTNNIFGVRMADGTPVLTVNSNGTRIAAGSNVTSTATLAVRQTDPNASAFSVSGLGAGTNNIFSVRDSSGTRQITVNSNATRTSFSSGMAFPPLSAPWASTFSFDFATNALQELIVTNTLTISAVNYSPGAVGALRLRPVNFATNYTINVDSSFNRYGSNFVTTSFVLASNKNAIVSLTSWGSHATNTAIAFRSQQ